LVEPSITFPLDKRYTLLIPLHTVMAIAHLVSTPCLTPRFHMISLILHKLPTQGEGPLVEKMKTSQMVPSTFLQDILSHFHITHDTFPLVLTIFLDHRSPLVRSAIHTMCFLARRKLADLDGEESIPLLLGR
jgi:hypothetical protein